MKGVSGLQLRSAQSLLHLSTSRRLLADFRFVEQGLGECSQAPTQRLAQYVPLRHPLTCKAGKAADKLDDTKPAVLSADLQRRKGRCYGCGAQLQVEVPMGAGYVRPDKYEQKKKHRQLDKVLCERCSDLCNGAMIPGVQDFTQKLQLQGLQQGSSTDEAAELMGKVLISPEMLRTQLMEVRSKKAVVVMLVDLLDVSGTLMSKVRDMTGKNPIILVGTKMDLLPAGCAPKDMSTWLLDAATRKRLNVVSVHLISSHTGEGISAATSKICRERKGRDVYVIGAANVGKSAFVRAMLKEMGKFESVNFDPAAISNGKYLPVESAMPGTTLGIIPLQAFVTGGTLYDTPGVHLHHRVPHMLAPDELKLLHPRKQLVPFVPPTPLELCEGEDEGDADLNDDTMPGGAGAQKKRKPSVVSATYVWSDLVRVDVIAGPPSTALAFYGPSTIKVYSSPLLKASQKFEVDEAGAPEGAGGRGGKLLSCSKSVEARGGLLPHHLLVKADAAIGRGALADIAISGLPGWITVWAPRSKRDVRVCVRAPRGVEVFLRPPLPCPCPLKADKDEQAAESLGEEGGWTEEQLASMMGQYGDADEALNDVRWWEAAVAELEGVDGGKDADEGDEEDVPVMYSATVEDILKQPRLDAAWGAIVDVDDDNDNHDSENNDIDDDRQGSGQRPRRRWSAGAYTPRPAGASSRRGGRPGRVKQGQQQPVPHSDNQ